MSFELDLKTGRIVSQGTAFLRDINKTMSDFKPIVSSNLHSAAYVDGAIVVRFKNGTAYKYPGCSPQLWKDFQKQFDGKQGRSAGKFLNTKLRVKAYEKLEDWQ